MTTDHPSVSVIIPVRDRSESLLRAIRSCLAQDCAAEILVVDDGSETNLRPGLEAEFPAETQSGALRILRQAPQGACTARNSGLAEARGDWVKFLDSDDELLPDTLPREIEAAQSANCDALLTGWEERTRRADGTEDPSLRRTRSAPDLSNGIDDMLDGKAPIVSGALYRRAFVRELRWNPEWKKAQDWGWALTVCLAGARFTSLDISSSIYWHHPGNRISARGNPLLLSTLVRQDFLRMIESRLREQDRLTEPRKKKLAQYFYRDCQVLARHDPARWQQTWNHCRELIPGFVPREPNRIIRLFCRLLGIRRGVFAYVSLKRLLLPSRPI